MNFVVGDLVRLTSGGPIMVIENPKADGGVVCTWFDRAGAKHTHTFAAVALKYATPEPSVTLRLIPFPRQVGPPVNRARGLTPAVVDSSRPEQHASSIMPRE